MLLIRTLYVLIRYGMFLYDMRQNSVSAEGKPNKALIAHLTENHIMMLFAAF